MTYFFHIVHSDKEHEDLVADFLCGDTEEKYAADLLGFLSQEDGFENMMIEIYPRGDGKPWLFRLDEFEKGLVAVKQRLWELRKTDVNSDVQEEK